MTLYNYTLLLYIKAKKFKHLTNTFPDLSDKKALMNKTIPNIYILCFIKLCYTILCVYSNNVF